MTDMNIVKQDSQRTLTMCAGVVAPHYQHHRCVVPTDNNSHKHTQSSLSKHNDEYCQ